MPCRLCWVVWRVKWINVHERDLYSNIILQSIITRCSSSMLRVIFGQDTCRFPFSSEIQPSKRRGDTRRWRWYFQNRERGCLQRWACLNSHRLLLLPAAAKLLWISLSHSQCWPCGWTWALEQRDSTFCGNTDTLTPTWGSGRPEGQTSELLCSPGQCCGGWVMVLWVCLTQHSFSPWYPVGKPNAWKREK